MSRLVSAAVDSRARTLAVLAAAVMAFGLVPWVGAEAARQSASHADRDDKLLFFAADGLRAGRASRRTPTSGAVPGFRELLRQGRAGRRATAC